MLFADSLAICNAEEKYPLCETGAGPVLARGNISLEKRILFWSLFKGEPPDWWRRQESLR